MGRPVKVLISLVICAAEAWGQASSAGVPSRTLAWQALGGRTVDLQLAGPAGGPVEGVAFSADGGQLYALTARGILWATADAGQSWFRSSLPLEEFRQLARANQSLGVAPPPQEAHALVYANPYDSHYVFALGSDLYRSSDGGRSWLNLTADAGGSLIGTGQRAIAFSPQDPAVVIVANSAGLWRSMDGGLSWSDLNRYIPNLPHARILRASATGSASIFLASVGPVEASSSGSWQLAQSAAAERWQRDHAQLPAADQARRSSAPLEAPSGWALSYRVWHNGAPVSPDLTACASAPCENAAQHYITAFALGVAPRVNYYAGTSDGHLWVSSDGGQSWRAAMQGFSASGAPVTDIFVSAQDSSIALVTAGGRGAGHIFRTTNAGAFWDDLSANLPDAPVHAAAANAETGSIYAASDAGVFYTRGDLRNPGPATPWTQLNGNLPQAAIEDIRLDPVDGSLYAAVAGYGLFRTTVPEIADSIRVLNAADLTARAAAPGGLLTVIGAPVRAAQAGSITAPVLASGHGNSQIQVPFESSGGSVDLTLETGLGSARRGFPLEEVSPAIFVDADGTPLVLDGASGVLLDSSRAARAGSQILILATGLGRVRPEWPTGVAAPVDNPPQTVAPVTAYLDGAPLRVLSSTLAGGYIGVYMVRVELPAMLNSGTGELAISSGDKSSNSVRIFLEP